MRIIQAKRELASQLAQRKDVLGVGIGYASKRGSSTAEIAIVVFVRKKLRLESVPADLLLPSSFRNFRVDVVEHAVTRPCNCGSERA